MYSSLYGHTGGAGGKNDKSLKIVRFFLNLFEVVYSISVYLAEIG
ncbi:MAG: hypothetical protein R3C24_00820 [Cyanobacteriota/Melainabacteria group bacterium]